MISLQELTDMQSDEELQRMVEFIYKWNTDNIEAVMNNIATAATAMLTNPQLALMAAWSAGVHAGWLLRESEYHRKNADALLESMEE